MRSFVHTFLGLLRRAIFVAFCAGIVAVTLAGAHCQGSDCWLWVLDGLKPHKATALVAAAGLLALEVLWFATRPRRHGARGAIRLRGKGGEVSVDVSAVDGELTALAEELPDVAGLVPELYARRKSVDIDLAVRVRRGADVPALCTELQKRARRTFAEHVGLLAVRRVDVRVVEFVKGSRAVSPDAPEPAVEPAESPSTGSETV